MGFRIAGRALVVLLLVVCGPAAALAQQLPSWVGTRQHTWQPKLGGTIWMFSRHMEKECAKYFNQYSRPVLVDIKSDGKGFGYRWDLDTWDSRHPSYGWFTWDGTDANTAATFEDSLQIFGATGNAEFVINLPSPRYPVQNPSFNPVDESQGYVWQTPEYYAAYAQYLLGTAGPASEYQALPRTLDYFSQPAGFNWANLRARRGRVAPYNVLALFIGAEPYFIEGFGDDGAAFGRIAEQYRRAIRARGVTAPLGLHVRDCGIADDTGGKWFWPMMANLTPGDFQYIDLHHYYLLSTQPATYQRTFPVAVNPRGYQGWWVPKTTWKSDYTKFLWLIEDTRNALRDYGLDPNAYKLGWTEHGILISTQFMFNDMTGGLHFALWLAEAMRGNITWDAAFTLVAEGFSHAQLQWRNNNVHRQPMFFAYQMALTFYGYDYLGNSFTSAMGSLTDVEANAIQFPWTVVRVFRDPATQRIHLFVVNQHATDTSVINGFESWRVVGWKQIRGASYGDGNPLDQAPPEPIQTRDVALPPRGQALAVPPISINHIVLEGAAGTPPNAPTGIVIR